MRLVDAHELEKKIAHHTVHDSLKRITFEAANVYEKVKCDMFHLVYTAHTVDAVEVVHGHYKAVVYGLVNVPVKLGICSECHKRIVMYVPTWDECNHYCPNCGAKMDGKE